MISSYMPKLEATQYHNKDTHSHPPQTQDARGESIESLPWRQQRRAAVMELLTF